MYSCYSYSKYIPVLSYIDSFVPAGVSHIKGDLERDIFVVKIENAQMIFLLNSLLAMKMLIF